MTIIKKNARGANIKRVSTKKEDLKANALYEGKGYFYITIGDVRKDLTGWKSKLKSN